VVIRHVSSRYWLPAAGSVLAALTIGVSLRFAPGVVALVVPAVVGLAILKVIVYLVCRWEDDEASVRRVERWTFAFFLVHLAIGLVITSSFRLTTYFGGDALQYDIAAREMLAHWLGNGPMPLLPSGKEGFYYMLAWLYWLFGAHTAAGLAVNAMFASALVPIVSDTTRRLCGPAAARWIPALVTLPPGFLLWPSQLLREAGVLFFLALVGNALVRLRTSARVAPALGLVASLAALLTFRHYIAFTVAGGAVVGLAVARRGIGGVTVAGGAALLLAALLFGAGFGYTGYQAVRSTNLEQANLIRQDSSVGSNSGFLAEADVSTGARALTYLPLALPRFVAGPFPWEIGGGRQLLALPDAAVWWALLPALVLGLRSAWRRSGRTLLLLFLPAGAASAVLSLLVANYGTLVRARIQVVVLLMPFIALGLAERRERRLAAAEHRMWMASQTAHLRPVR
jgi:hypothetical protein